ncbi:MAG: hypothetical protein N2545_06630 [Thermoflexales bacterium]|nr:hypothetical protein [Thermoflexales bacterium]
MSGAPRQSSSDLANRLRILALLAAPVHDPEHPDPPPTPLDLHWEWHELCQAARESQIPLYLTRLQPPTLDKLRPLSSR